MGDPFSVGAIFAFLNSAVKFSECAIKLYGVETENGVFVRMIQQVRIDLEETERLLHVPSVRAKVLSTPGKLPWIKGTILGAKTAINEIGRWVERVRAEKEGYGSVSLENRIRWVFHDNEKLLNRRLELGTSHQSLSNVLQYLVGLEGSETQANAAPPLYEHVTFLDDILSPRQRRRKARDAEKDFGAKSVDQRASNVEMFQPLQAPSSSICAALQPIAPNDVGYGDAGTSGDPNFPQPSDSPSSPSWSSTTGRMSSSPLPSSTIGSIQFPNFKPTASFPKHATQVLSSKSIEVPPISQSSSGSVSSVPRYPASPWTTMTLVSSPMTELPSITSPTPSWVSQQFSATNSQGPRDPFDLYAESDAGGSSTCSQDKHPVVVESYFATDHPTYLENSCQGSAHSDILAELTGDLFEHHEGNHGSLDKMPQNNSLAQSAPTDLPLEIPAAVPSWLEIPSSQSKIPRDTTERRVMWPTLATKLPAESYSVIERSQNPPPQFDGDGPTSTHAELPSHSLSSISPAHQQYPSSTTSWSPPQPRDPSRVQPQHQSQYQSYPSPVPILVSHAGTPNPTIAATPSPIPWQKQQYRQNDEPPVSPPTWGTTAAQPATLPAEQERSRSGSMTLGEARRRNRRALLDLMSRGGYG